MDTKNVTRNDVAKHAGVAPSTVSHVVNNKPGIGADTISKVHKSIKELGYVPNDFAQKLIAKRYKTNEGKKLTSNIGCIIYDTYSKFKDKIYADIVEAIDAELRNKNHRLFFYNRKSELAENPLLLNNMISKDTIDALVVISTQLEGIYEQVTGRIKNIISIGELLNKEGEFDCILFDDQKMGWDAAAYLAKMNHKKLGYLGKVHPRYPRLAGYKNAISDLGLEYDEKLFVHVVPEGVKSRGVELGYEYMKKMLDEKKSGGLPTAVYVEDDELCLGALKAINENGLKVPQDISLITSGSIDNLQYSEPSITSFVLNEKNIASIAVNRLLEKIRNPVTIPVKMVIPYELIERGSMRKL